MRIGVIIPDRGDRPDFLNNCLRMLYSQTIKSEHLHLEIVNDTPLSDQCDITWRYRTGYERLRDKNLDVIALIENDDWYAPNYLETMLNEWEKQGNPDLLGTSYTIYYHIRLFSYFTMHHSQRSSAMSTLIKPDLNFEWCADNDPYSDIHLWKTLNGKIFVPQKHICLGIKHGVGKLGGRSHIDKLERYINSDLDKKFIKEIMDKESFKFYSNYFLFNNIST
jgi:glycosyltransferase involved in cell wall biosynthesis